MSAPNLGWLTWLAMLAVLGAAAVLSFAALRDLAVQCGVEPALAWLLPVCVDAGAAVSTRVWLDGRAVHAERFARRMTWAMLAVTVAGNALHGGLVAAGMTPTWWTAVAVSAVPPAVVGATVHLAVLIGRQAHTKRSETVVAASVDTGRGAGTRGPAPSSSRVQPGPTPDDLLGSQEMATDDRAAALIAEGAGRRRLARELEITEHAAREILDGYRNGHRVVGS